MPIQKAEGVFYQSTGSQGGFGSNALITGASIRAAAKPSDDILYSMSGGQKRWLRIFSVNFDKNGGRRYSVKPIEVLENVRLPIPTATAYHHMNYGLWEPLGKEADANGIHAATGRGTAFVTALVSGRGMTSDMPNFGSASYKGHWVASIRAADAAGNGAIVAEAGGMTAAADFRKDALTVDLFSGQETEAISNRLAQLTGTIDGNGFSGTGVSMVSNAKGGLTASTDGRLYIVKEFKGAFFGPKVVEVGGRVRRHLGGRQGG